MGHRDAIAREISVMGPKIARAITAGFSALSDIPPSQIFAILGVHERGPCHLSELSKALHVSAPTATGIIDRLEKSGYVKRIPDQDDRRAINIELTPQGITVAKKIRSAIQKQWSVLLEKLNLDECNTYLKLFKKIYQSVEDNENIS